MRPRASELVQALTPQEQAQDVVASAERAERAAQWPAALQAYQRAQLLDPTLKVDDRIARIREQMLEEGAKAYQDARQYSAFKQYERATPLYRRALEMLPPDDPRRAEAERALEQMKERR